MGFEEAFRLVDELLRPSGRQGKQDLTQKDGGLPALIVHEVRLYGDAYGDEAAVGLLEHFDMREPVERKDLFAAEQPRNRRHLSGAGVENHFFAGEGYRIQQEQRAQDPRRPKGHFFIDGAP